MLPSTVVQSWPVALLSRPRVSAQDLELRKPLVGRRVLVQQTIASSPWPKSEFQSVQMSQEQRREPDERFSFISPSPIICRSLDLPKTTIVYLAVLTIHVSTSSAGDIELDQNSH